MTKKPETPQTPLDSLSDITKGAEKLKVKLTPEIEKEIREHLAEAQARAERGEPMTQEMKEFMENVRLWVGMPEWWREKFKAMETMKKDIEAMKQAREAPQEAKQRHISVEQWLDFEHLLYMASKASVYEGVPITDDEWIGRNILFPGKGKIETKESLDIRKRTEITRLPEGLMVGGGLNLDGCTEITELPKGMMVRWSLCLRDCIALTRLPADLEVGGNLDLTKNLNEQVKNDAERLKKDGRIKGKIIIE